MNVVAENRRAAYDYDIKERFHAGIVLNGQEVKSIKLGRAQLQGSFVVAQRGELFWVGATIPAYQPTNAPPGYQEERQRKLLLQKHEISHIIGSYENQGLTFLPIRLYTVKGKIKLEFALAKKHKKGDKRQIIKKREAEREMRRSL
ncbi:MAG: SsrA-binding protein SmpB [Parcubacteria group bacterium]|nr:SsrA-binding protein SmpB [Parcubacteria group bacterium]MBI4217321.1 SsrA-binding protein SmpB [Parcubacteria group bacterium]